MKFGPVASATKDIIDSKSGFSLTDDQINYGQTYIKKTGIDYISLKEAEKKVFSKTDLAIAEIIYEQFGQIERFELREFSHKFPEWAKFEEDINKSHGRSSFDMDIEDFFENVNGVSELFKDDAEDLKMVKDIYQEQEKINSDFKF